MIRLIAILALVSILFSGCTGTFSDNPLYTEADLVDAPEFLGEWQGTWEEDVYVVSQIGEKVYRAVKRSDPTDVVVFRIVRLDDHYFLDVEQPSSNNCGRHMLCRVLLLGDRIYWYSLKNEYEKGVRYRLGGGSGNTTVLTASTSDLQAHMLRLVDNPSAWSKPGPSVAVKTRRIGIGQHGITSRKYRTFNYWHAYKLILNRDITGGKPEQVAEEMKSTAKLILEMPILGVDKEITEPASESAQILVAMAEMITRSNSPDILLESFVRGLLGDPLGSVTDIYDSQNRLQQRWSACLARIQQARLVLSDRYDLPFPPIE